jgi:hypothetical protein
MRRRMHMRTRVIVSAALAAAVAATGLVMSGGSASAGIDPADFTSPVKNPYFPITPGKVFVYRGTEGGDRLVEHLRVTQRTKTIQGVTTTVISDILFSNGVLGEKTTDWYANDNAGNVWYFGEKTATYRPNGQIESREGSWLAGVNGGVAGIIMPADPKPTDAYRQEFLVRHAEDQAWIVTRHESATVPYGAVDEVVRSYEWTRLEPNVVSEKLYAPHLGIVQEGDIAGGTEFMQLVDVRHV